ncbi:MAG: hypothetical protein KBA61_03655 [Spirochaetes bacterium]|nr:hypothetical protein [Spirochaetota bacterium]
MYKETTGRMESHVSHDLSFKGTPRREYAVRDFGFTSPRVAVETRCH